MVDRIFEFQLSIKWFDEKLGHIYNKIYALIAQNRATDNGISGFFLESFQYNDQSLYNYKF